MATEVSTMDIKNQNESDAETISTYASTNDARASFSKPAKPNLFGYSDYRLYLKDFFEFKKNTNATYSASMFTRKAGLGTNSRGYLKLIIEGKRNLTFQTLRGFCEALTLTAQESIFFENLVLFNQAEKDTDRRYYFDRAKLAAGGNSQDQFEILSAQIDYLTHWYTVAVRELVALPDFKENGKWICQQLRGKIHEAQAETALKNLTTLGLISRDPTTGKWRQATPLVRYQNPHFNRVATEFHIQMLENTKQALLQDPFESRRASALTLNVDQSEIEFIVKEIDTFRNQLLQKILLRKKQPNSVVQVGFQVFQLTPTDRNPKPQTKKRKEESL